MLREFQDALGSDEICSGLKDLRSWSDRTVFELDSISPLFTRSLADYSCNPPPQSTQETNDVEEEPSSDR